MAQKPRIVFFPSPGMGHLIPLVEIAKKFILSHDLSATFIIPTLGQPPKAMEEVLESLPEAIDSVVLPPVSLEDLPDNTRAETRICLTVARSLPSVRDVFQSLVANERVVGLVVDLFGSDAFDVAAEFKVPPYMAHLSTAMTASLIFHLPKLDEMVSCEYTDMAEPILLPGCRIPIQGKDLPDPALDRKDDAYKWFLHLTKKATLAHGFFMNSFTELETENINYFHQKKERGIPPVYPIGPVIQSGSKRNQANESECLKWLDEQPSGSVLFVSFGSGGTLSLEQLHELALGLEMSEQKFLWVVRSPAKSANAAYFSAKSNDDPLAFLPEGFVERTKGQGMLVPSWAPQIQVLSHSSTGGFLTHCGWNSILESIVYGVPLIAWPLYAEQKMNAVLLAQSLIVALRPKANEDGTVGREEIAKVVKGLMQGEEGVAIHDRMNKLKEAAAMAVSEDSKHFRKSLQELVSIWKNQNNA